MDQLDLNILAHLQRDGRTPYTEIASELDIAVGTIKSRARLGFRRLRQLLEDE